MTIDKSFEDLVNSLSATNIPEVTAPGIATKEEINNVIQSIAQDSNPSLMEEGTLPKENYDRISISICELSIRGGTSPKFSETAASSYTAPIIITQKQFKNACTKCKTTTRKIARGLRNEALHLARNFKMAGNLSKAYKLKYPQATSEELIWCNDFFTFAFDTEMPDQVRDFLIENYNTRFRAKK